MHRSWSSGQRRIRWWRMERNRRVQFAIADLVTSMRTAHAMEPQSTNGELTRSYLSVSLEEDGKTTDQIEQSEAIRWQVVQKPNPPSGTSLGLCDDDDDSIAFPHRPHVV